MKAPKKISKKRRIKRDQFHPTALKKGQLIQFSFQGDISSGKIFDISAAPVGGHYLVGVTLSEDWRGMKAGDEYLVIEREIVI